MMGDDELGAIEYFVTERCGLVFDLRSRTKLMDAMPGFLATRGFDNASALLRTLGDSDFDDPLCLDLMALPHETETQFFRDPQSFDYLTGGGLARLLKHKESTKKISVWSGAAGTGQEVWSLAMMLDEALDRTMDWRFEILATDICAESLRYAEAGVYTRDEVNQGLSEDQLSTFFEESDEGYRVVDSLRQSVSFKRLNLASTLGALPIFDLIFLRHCLETMREDVLE
ncbi:MAG: CheR family methyltransferase, partial [Myxococcota bacterium]|nr:CheR family methyltransferase [Myxococcota bacterium]